MNNEHNNPPTRHSSTAKRLTIAGLATVGLATVGLATGAVITAAAANASGSGSSSSSSPSSSSANRTPTPPKPGANGGPGAKGHGPGKPGPHIDGTVRTIAGDTITVTDLDGFTRTIEVSSDTTYTQNRSSTGESAVTKGRFLHAAGSVDSNGTTLDATSISIFTSGTGRPVPIGRPIGPGGMKGHRPASGPGVGGTPPAPGHGKAPGALGGHGAPAAPSNRSAPSSPSAAPTTGSTAHGS